MADKAINGKLVQLAKLLKTLSDKELEKALINRAVLDRIYLMRRSKKTGFRLFEAFSFRELYLLEKELLGIS